MVEHVAGDDGRHARGLRQVGELAQPDRIPRPPAQAQCKIAAVRELPLQPGRRLTQGSVGRIRQQHRDQAVAAVHEVRPGEVATALAALPFPKVSNRQSRA